MHKTKSHDRVLQRRLRISELYREGLMQWQIGKQLGVGQQQISRDLKAIRREWRTSAVAKYEEKIALELARVDQLEAEAWAAYERSVGTYKTVTKEGKAAKPAAGKGSRAGDANLLSQKVTVKEEKLAGDPRFFNVVLDCIARRCKILGLDAPEKHELGAPGGGPIEAKIDGACIDYDRFARAFMEHTRKRLREDGMAADRGDRPREPVHPEGAVPEAGPVPRPSAP